MVVLLINAIALVAIFGVLTAKLDVAAWNMVSFKSRWVSLGLTVCQDDLQPFFSKLQVAHPKEAKIASPAFEHMNLDLDDELQRKAAEALERYKSSMSKQGVDIDHPGWKKQIAVRL